MSSIRTVVLDGATVLTLCNARMAFALYKPQTLNISLQFCSSGQLHVVPGVLGQPYFFPVIQY